MSIKKYAALIVLSSALVACDKEPEEMLVPQTSNYRFEDGFETQNNTLDELFPSDGSRWSTIQQTNPSNATNEISLSESEFSEGESSLRLFSFQSDSELSKIDIEKNGLNLLAGDKLTIKADFYITGTANLENLLLMDLECCSCWDPEVGDNLGAENQCPGVRLMMSGGNDFLSIERGKISGTTIQQTNVAFPRNQWVSVEWSMVLSDDETGLNSLSIDGFEVINENGMNMPNAEIFSELFADEGIEFVLQEPSFYERVQIGATANPTAGDVEMYIDNFSIEVE